MGAILVSILISSVKLNSSVWVHTQVNGRVGVKPSIEYGRGNVPSADGE